MRPMRLRGRRHRCALRPHEWMCSIVHTVQHPPPGRSPTRMRAQGTRRLPRSLTRSRRPQPPAGPAFLAARAVGGASPALPWVDAAAPGRGGRRGCPVSRSGEWQADARRRGFGRGAVGGQRRGSTKRWPAVAAGSPALVSGERR